MTRERKSIQKEGASEVTMHGTYHCRPHEILLSMALIPFQYEKMIVHKIFFKVRNELTFPLGWYITLHSKFVWLWLKHMNFQWRVPFLTSKCISIILNIILKGWTIILLHIFVKISWSLMILRIKKIMKIIKYYDYSDVILTSLATTFLWSKI